MPVPETYSEIVIQGITEAGTVFRPSDWAERLCGIAASFGDDKRLRYSPYLKPVIIGDAASVVVDLRLAAANPAAYDHLMSFVRDNRLRTRAGRHERRPNDVWPAPPPE